MKSSFLTTIIFLIIVTSNQVSAKNFGNCSLLYPRESTAVGQSCGRSYGIMYFNYLAKPVCYRKRSAAEKSMKSMKACQQGPTYRNCQIMFPGERGSHCGNKFGIRRGPWVKSLSCYPAIGDAIHAMRTITCGGR